MEPLTESQQQLFDWITTYIQQHQHPPSIRQMMQAMHLKSPAPVQSRLEHLRAKGYIDWTQGQARTLRILHSQPSQADNQGIPVLGVIAAGGLMEPFTDEVEHLDLAEFLLDPEYFALRVTGDSMIEDLITEGDVVILRPVQEPDRLKNGTVVAAWVEGHGTTLKHFYRQGNQVTLKPANAQYAPIQIAATQVQVQGALIGVWRGLNRNK
jgi:repressor LexA